MELNYKRLNELAAENERLKAELEKRELRNKRGKSCEKQMNAIEMENAVLKKELENERYRADRYADICAASMEYGWESVPEEEMEKAGFTKTETGWKVSK